VGWWEYAWWDSGKRRAIPSAQLNDSKGIRENEGNEGKFTPSILATGKNKTQSFISNATRAIRR
jgi:hypothetical protein